MKKFRIAGLSALMIAMLLVGCGGGAQSTDTPAPSETAPVVEELNLEELYNQGIEALSELGDSAPILFPETNVDYLENFYPGLAEIEFKQFYAGVAPVTNAPFEIILTEVANSEDVEAVKEIFQTRVDKECDDSTYPENAEAWMNKTQITSRGNYVFLAVLMDPAEIPAEFILD